MDYSSTPFLNNNHLNKAIVPIHQSTLKLENESKKKENILLLQNHVKLGLNQDGLLTPVDTVNKSLDLENNELKLSEGSDDIFLDSNPIDDEEIETSVSDSMLLDEKSNDLTRETRKAARKLVKMKTHPVSYNSYEMNPQTDDLLEVENSGSSHEKAEISPSQSSTGSRLKSLIKLRKLKSISSDLRISEADTTSDSVFTHSPLPASATPATPRSTRNWVKFKVIKPLLSKSKKNKLTESIELLEDERTVKTCKRMTFNVGGTMFQTLEKNYANVKRKDTFKLANRCFLERHFDAVKGEYFFDRDPEVFRAVLNYWRTGHLHLPTNMCGPLIKEELDYWGLDEQDIRPCCWYNYNDWMQTMSSLEQLQRDRRPSYHNQEVLISQRKKTIGLKRVTLAIWRLLTEPSSSRIARFYAYISLMFVILAIFSFCASTHKIFHLEKHSRNISESNNETNLSLDNLILNRTDSNLTYDTSSDLYSNQPKNKEKPKKFVTFRQQQLHPALFYIDVVCLLFFTLEYLIRLFCAPKRCRFLVSFIAIIDLCAILPDYIEIIVYSFWPDQSNTHAFVNLLPFLRLMRAFRIFRLIRRVPGLWIMMYTLKASFKELSLMLVILLVGTLFFSSVIYFVDDQTSFKSIPHGFWWAIVTMTTVGYGDMTPQTALGKCVGSITAVCGVLIIGFTIPSLVNNFITYYRHVEFVVRQEKLTAGEYITEMGDIYNQNIVYEDDKDDEEKHSDSEVKELFNSREINHKRLPSIQSTDEEMEGGRTDQLDDSLPGSKFQFVNNS